MTAQQNAIPSIAIIGAGAAGLATALAFRKIGWHVQVFQPNPQGPRVGALFLWSNGIKALTRAGVPIAALVAHAHLAHHMDFLSWEGHRLWRMPVAELSSRAEAPSLVIDRQDLLDLLRQLAESRGVTIEHRRFVALQPQHTGVEVWFDSGLPATFDLVVGADGASSDVRQALVSDPVSRDTGQTTVFGYSKIPGGSTAPSDSFVLMNEDVRFWGGRTREPTRMFWGLSVPAVGDLISKVAPQQPSTEQLTILRHLFRGALPVVDDLLRSPEQCRLTHSYTRLACPSTAAYRVALVGDSAHVLTYDLGQGLCLGLEDAVHLANAVRNCPLPGALARFERGRIKRTRIIGEWSYWASQLSTPKYKTLAHLRDLFTSSLYPPINNATMRYILAADLPELKSTEEPAMCRSDLV